MEYLVIYGVEELSYMQGQMEMFLMLNQKKIQNIMTHNYCFPDDISDESADLIKIT